MAASAMWILLIKGDEKPRRLRVRSFFAVLVLAFVLLVLGVGAGIFGIQRLNDNAEMRQKIRNLNLIKAQVDQDLARLQDRIGELEARFTGYRPQDTPPPNDDPEHDENENQEGQDTRLDVNLIPLFSRVDLGIVNVDNLSFSRTGETELHVTYDLTNRSGQLQTGDGQVLLILRDGREVDMPLSGRDLYFEIRNFKKVAATATLPQDVSWEDVYATALRLFDQDGRTLLRVVRVLGGS